MIYWIGLPSSPEIPCSSPTKPSLSQVSNLSYRNCQILLKVLFLSRYFFQALERTFSQHLQHTILMVPWILTLASRKPFNWPMPTPRKSLRLSHRFLKTFADSFLYPQSAWWNLDQVSANTVTKWKWTEVWGCLFHIDYFPVPFISLLPYLLFS